MGYDYAQERSFDTLEGAATNPGGMQSGLMGAGIGLGIGAGVGGSMGGQFAGIAQNLNLTGARTCPQCGGRISPQARFCEKCGCDTQSQFNLRSCKKCGAKNAPEAKFCIECGETLVKSCPGCGLPLENDAIKFCPECGAALHKTCPKCKAVLEGAPKYCPQCGEALL